MSSFVIKFFKCSFVDFRSICSEGVQLLMNEVQHFQHWSLILQNGFSSVLDPCIRLHQSWSLWTPHICCAIFSVTFLTSLLKTCGRYVQLFLILLFCWTRCSITQVIKVSRQVNGRSLKQCPKSMAFIWLVNLFYFSTTTGRKWLPFISIFFHLQMFQYIFTINDRFHRNFMKIFFMNYSNILSINVEFNITRNTILCYIQKGSISYNIRH